MLVINHGKLIPEETLSAKLKKKKLFRKTQLYNYIKRYQKNLQIDNGSQKIDISQIDIFSNGFIK